MTIYVDPIRQHPSGPWCHMATDDDLDELHEVAAQIGLKRSWFQDHPDHPHYDLRPSKRVLAVQAGAVEVNQYELVILCSGKPKYAELRERLLAKLRESEVPNG